MKLVVRVKLLPTPVQAAALEATLAACNEAATWAAEVAFETGARKPLALRKHTYQQAKERWGLGAQAAQHAIKKTCDAYTTLAANLKNGRYGQPGSKRHTRASGKPVAFRTDAAQPYDDRMLSWQHQARTLSIWTTAGRMKNVAFTGQAEQLAVLARCRRGESDLVCQGGKWFLLATCEIPETALNAHPVAFLGVDLGIVNIAATSDGERHSGRRINRKRENDRALRCKLQKKNTKSAKRRAKKYAGREARRNKDINHKISKRIVAEAARTGRGFALEELTGIRERVRLRKPGGTSHALKAVGEHHAPLLALRPARRVPRLQGATRRGPGGVHQPGVHQPGMLPVPSHRTRQPALTSRLRLPVLRIR